MKTKPRQKPKSKEKHADETSSPAYKLVMKAIIKAETAVDERAKLPHGKMINVTPNEVVFNGVAFQYNDHPLSAKVGQRVRFYVVNAGPNLASAFHIIGGMFAAVYPDGDAAHAPTGVSTYPIAPGQGMVLDAIMPQPSKYPFVDHSMRDMMIGAAGELSVTS